MSGAHRVKLISCAGLLLFPLLVMSQDNNPAGKAPVRARPPQFPKTVTDLFPPDAKVNLSGERPDFNNISGAGMSPSGTATRSGMSGGNGGIGTAPASGAFAWSKLISADVLADEIKSTKAQLAEDLKTPTAFKGGGFKKARRVFSVTAVMFAVIAEYDGEVKWKSQAVSARELFARAGFNSKVATDQAYNEAKLRLEDLDTLLGGGTIQGPADADPKNAWAKVANRPPLMNRMEQAQQTNLQPWTASEDEFKKNSEKIAREAMILATLAEVISRDGFEYSNDSTYVGFAKDLVKASASIVDGVKNKNYNQARKAVSDAGKACSNCHGAYRS